MVCPEFAFKYSGSNQMHVSVGYILGWAGPGARGKQCTDSNMLIIIEAG